MVTEDDDERPARRRPRAEPEATGGRWPMADRSVLASVLGVRPIVAIALGAALTAVGVVVDLTRIGSLGTDRKSVV